MYILYVYIPPPSSLAPSLPPSLPPLWVGFGWARTTNQFRSIATQDSYAVPFSICVRVWALSLVASS